MNIFQLTLKQMRQRALSTWLTMFSVVLGVTLVVAILILRREGDALFGQSDYGFNVLVGAKASPLQLTLNTIYHMDRSPGNIPYAVYDELAHGEKYRPQVKLAVPFAVGDSYKGLRIVGTTTAMFGVDDEGKAMGQDSFEYRPDRHYEIAQGHLFHPRKFEAIVGAEVPALTGLKIGDTFQATHGLPTANETPDVHEEQWKVVGVLAPTHTANDRVLFIPLPTFYCIFEHEEGLEAHAQIKAGQDIAQVAAHHHEDHEQKQYTMNPDGTVELQLPRDKWELSAVLVKARSSFAAQQLLYVFSSRDDAAAVNPASVMRDFFQVFLRPSTLVLLVISYLVTIVAAASIMTTIYNSVSARRREMAILRALGATRARILGLICLEAVIIGAGGALVGVVLGHLLSGVGAIFLQQMVGERIDWLTVGIEEWKYVLLVTGLALVAGLVPALKAYSTSVARNLVVS